jgi:hypothetical protein
MVKIALMLASSYYKGVLGEGGGTKCLPNSYSVYNVFGNLQRGTITVLYTLRGQTNQKATSKA